MEPPIEPPRSINNILSIQNLSNMSYIESSSNPSQSPHQNSSPSSSQSTTLNIQSFLQCNALIQRYQQQLYQQLPTQIPPHTSLTIHNDNNNGGGSSRSSSTNNNTHNNITNISNDSNSTNINHILTPDPLNTSGSSTSGHHRTQNNGSRITSVASTNSTPAIVNPHSSSSKHGRNCNHEAGKELIDLVTCKLCKGYLIDAATIDLCMHSFCRPCAVKFIRDKHRCPECNIEIRDKRFLNRLKSDVTLQNIVYKLVPGLYENEMARRRKFYAERPTQTPRYKSEMFGDIPPCKTIRPDDMLNISITWDRDGQDDDPIKTYFLCRADSTIRVLKKLIIRKFGLDWPIKIYYGSSEIFFDLTTLIDVATTFNWSPESKVLSLSFKEQPTEQEEERINKNSQTSQVNSSPLVSSGLDP